MNENNQHYLDLFVSNTGKKIKTFSMTLNQNSNSETIRLMTEGNPDSIEVWFRQPNGRISPKYHMTYKQIFSPDTIAAGDDKYDFLKDYGEFRQWEFNIPLGITSFTMPHPTARLEVSFAFYKTTDNQRLIVTSVANSQILVNRSNNDNTLDDGYSASDVDNLWKAVGQNTQAINDLKDNLGTKVEPSTEEVDGAKELRNLNINGENWKIPKESTGGSISVESDLEGNVVLQSTGTSFTVSDDGAGNVKFN